MPEADDGFPARECHCLDPRVWLLLRRDRGAVRLAVAAHQGSLSCGRDPGGAIFLEWCFIRIPWLYNYSTSGAIEVPMRTLVRNSGDRADSGASDALSGRAQHRGRHDLVASNLVHGRIGRMWMAVRDMDLAAELIGIGFCRTKLLAFAVSSFYCGVAGAMMVFLWYGGAEADVFAIDQSFLIVFMVIIGGLGTLMGSFFGAALIFILPIVLRAIPTAIRVTDPSSHRGATDIRDLRRANHPLSGGRTKRPGAAVANRETEIEGLALSLLMVHTRLDVPLRRIGRPGPPSNRRRERA